MTTVFSIAELLGHKSDLLQALEELSQRRKENQEQQERIEEFLREKLVFSQELNDTKSRLENLQQENGHLQEQMRLLYSIDAHANKDEIQRLQEAIATSKGTIANLKKEIGTLSLANHQLERSLKQAEQKMTSSEKLSRVAMERLKSVELTVETLTRQLQESQEMHNLLKRNVSAVTLLNKELGGAFTHSHCIITELREDKKRLNEEICKIKCEVRLCNDMKTKDKNPQEYEIEIANLEKKMRYAEQEGERRHATMVKLQNEIEEYKALSVNTHKIAQKTAADDKAFFELKKEFEVCKNENAVLQQKCFDISGTLEALKQKHEICMNDAKQESSRNAREQEKKITEISEKLEYEKEQMLEKLEIIKEKEELIEGMKRKMGEAAEESKLLEEDCVRFRRENEESQKKIKELSEISLETRKKIDKYTNTEPLYQEDGIAVREHSDKYTNDESLNPDDSCSLQSTVPSESMSKASMSVFHGPEIKQEISPQYDSFDPSWHTSALNTVESENRNMNGIELTESNTSVKVKGSIVLKKNSGVCSEVVSLENSQETENSGCENEIRNLSEKTETGEERREETMDNFEVGSCVVERIIDNVEERNEKEVEKDKTCSIEKKNYDVINLTLENNDQSSAFTAPLESHGNIPEEEESKKFSSTECKIDVKDVNSSFQPGIIPRNPGIHSFANSTSLLSKNSTITNIPTSQQSSHHHVQKEIKSCESPNYPVTSNFPAKLRNRPLSPILNLPQDLLRPVQSPPKYHNENTPLKKVTQSLHNPVQKEIKSRESPNYPVTSNTPIKVPSRPLSPILNLPQVLPQTVKSPPKYHDENVPLKKVAKKRKLSSTPPILDASQSSISETNDVWDVPTGRPVSLQVPKNFTKQVLCTKQAHGKFESRFQPLTFLQDYNSSDFWEDSRRTEMLINKRKSTG